MHKCKQILSRDAMPDLEICINENERIDDLQYKGLKVIQKRDGFCFGIDAVLLADFADVKKGDKVIDLGTGTGIIPILLAGKTHAKKIIGLEILPEMSEMAARSVQLNKLEDRVQIICGDINNSLDFFAPSSFNVVTTNPPYMNKGEGIINASDNKAISRHEILCTLKDVIRISSELLIQGGRFAMVHRPRRLVDIICLMRQYDIEPKHIRFIYPSPYKKANLLLIKGIKNGRPELKMMEPLYVYNEKGLYSDEINRIYNRGSEVGNYEQ